MSADAQRLWVDATVLSNLSVAGGSSFLTRIVDQPVTTGTVAEEIKRGVDAGYSCLGVISEALGEEVPVLSITRDDSFRQLRERLDAGEATCLLGAVRRGGVVATDDAAARATAEQRGIELTGSVGLLAVGVQRNAITVQTANQWLERWQTEREYYAPVDRIEVVLDG